MNKFLHTVSINIFNRTRFILPILAAICLSAFAISCTSSKSAAPENNYAKFIPPQHIVFIGLDGWGGDYVTKANMPTVKRMISEGAAGLKLRCIMPSNTFPNWAALFTGTPPANHNSENFPSIFTLVKNNGQEKKLALFYEAKELKTIVPADIAENREILSNLESALSVAAYIKEIKPAFTAVVFNEPDSAGHNYRWGSKTYYDKLNELDGFIAVIEQAVKDAGIYNETVFVMSSDHGGTFWGHGYNIPRQRKIPLVIYGRGIKENYTISANRSICDIAPTMAAILGLKIPAEWTGQPIMEIFK